jgi:drug/metabolite transporter (DMT)-like permease
VLEEISASDNTVESTPSRKKTLLADLGLLYSSAIWGSTFFLVKNSLDSINPVTMVAYRFLLAAVLMGIVLRLQGKTLFTNFSSGIILGALLALLYVPQTIGLGYTTAANSAFITGLFVVFVPVLSLTLLKEKPRRAQWLAVIISLAGLWLLTGGLQKINLGDLITLFAAFTNALLILLADRFIHNGGDVYQLTFQQFLVAGAGSLAATFIFKQPLAVHSLQVIWVVVFLAVFPSLSAFFIQFKAQELSSPVKVSVILATEPVFAGIFAWTLGGETFIPLRAFGGLLIFLAMIVSTVRAPAP